MSSTPHPPSRSPLPAAFASIMGWSFDLFDLFLLLYVAGPVGKVIFPAESETLSLALVFASFAVSIVMRPGGAALFGHFADRHGRKKIMVTVLLGVGLSTAAMGAVPTHTAIGVAAPIAFLTLRVIQGLFVGGVTATTHTLGIESVPSRWRGMLSGLVGAGGAGIGAAVASIAFIVVSNLFPGDSFNGWGWRIMFYTGLLGALLSFFVLRKVEESPLWEAARRTGTVSPAARRLGFRDIVAGRFGRVTALNVALAAGGGAQYYLTSGFMPTSLDSVVGMPSSSRGWVLLVASLVVVVASAVAGELSERIGRRPAMLLFGVANLVLLPVCTLALTGSEPDSTGRILLFSCLLAFLANAAYAPVMVFLNERYPTQIRSRGTALSWNTGFMLGGLLPTFVNLVSPTVGDIPSRLVIFLLASCAVFVVAGVLVPETRGNLDGPGGRTAPQDGGTLEFGGAPVGP